MISDAFLKLAVATFIGGVIFYKFSKNKVKQEDIHKKKDKGRGKIAPKHTIKPPEMLKQKQKLKKALKPTHLFRK